MATEDPNQLYSTEFEVFGQVQGCYFTKYCKEVAETIGIVGWVKNSKQGTIVGKIQGVKPLMDQIFTCRLYDGQTEHINVSEVRIDLFASKNKLVTSLPPTSAALYKHARRAAYQAGHIWGNALKPEVSTPCPSSWGCTKEKESWTPEWSAVTAIWSQLSLLDHCGCKSGCETMHCGCRRVSLPCTAQCKSCKGGCTNQKISWLSTAGSPGCKIQKCDLTNSQQLARLDYKDFTIRF